MADPAHYVQNLAHTEVRLAAAAAAAVVASSGHTMQAVFAWGYTSSCWSHWNHRCDD